MEQLPGFLGEVAAVVLPALETLDIALAGGNGLRAHGVTTRPSNDLDTYSASFETAIYEQAGQLVLDAARAAGWNAELEIASDWFRGITIWRPGTNPERDSVGIDIGQEYRTRSAQRRMARGGLVMDLDDISAGKCRALCDRREAHDFADVACLLTHPGWNLDRLYANAKTAVPNLTPMRSEGGRSL